MEERAVQNISPSADIVAVLINIFPFVLLLCAAIYLFRNSGRAKESLSLVKESIVLNKELSEIQRRNNELLGALLLTLEDIKRKLDKH